MFLASKTQVIMVKRGVATKRFLFEPVFATCEKLSLFGPFFGKFGLMFKKHNKIGISAHFEKQKMVNMTMLKRHYLVQGRGIIWSKLVSPKKQLGPDDERNLLKPLFYSVFDRHCFKNKLGPDNAIKKTQTWTR